MCFCGEIREISVDFGLTLVMLNKLMPYPFLIFSQSDYLVQAVDTNLHAKTNSTDPDQLASSE